MATSVAEIVEQAEQAFKATGSSDLTEARGVFEAELFERVDELQEGAASERTEERVSAVDQLWVAYASFEQRWRQWKKAVHVLEAAAQCPIASKRPAVWLHSLFAFRWIVPTTQRKWKLCMS